MPARAFGLHGMRTACAAINDPRLIQCVFARCPSPFHQSLPVELQIEILAIHLQLIFATSCNLLWWWLVVDAPLTAHADDAAPSCLRLRRSAPPKQPEEPSQVSHIPGPPVSLCASQPSPAGLPSSRPLGSSKGVARRTSSLVHWPLESCATCSPSASRGRDAEEHLSSQSTTTTTTRLLLLLYYWSLY